MSAARLVVALTAASILASPAQAQNVITQPDWLRRPSGEDMAHVYPMLANGLELEGQATVACDVTAAGLLDKCQAVASSPAGLGFAEAALALTPTFRMRPQTLNGEPVAGGTVRIPINFRLPEPKAADLPAALPGGEANFELARRVVDGLGPAETVREEFLARSHEVAESEDPGVSAADRSAAAAALRAAIDRRQPDLREAMARGFAETLDTATLTALAQAAATPGKIMWRPTPGRVLLEEELNNEFWRRVGPLARTAFCAKRSCDADGRAFLPSASDPIWEPIWADEPSAAQITAAAPMITRLLGVGGRVKLRCRITRNGVLEECQTVAESPAGLGYRPLRSASRKRTGSAPPRRAPARPTSSSPSTSRFLRSPRAGDSNSSRSRRPRPGRPPRLI